MPIKRSVLLLIAVAIGLFSCKNNDNVFKPVTNTDLTVVNATTDTINFYINGTRQNNASSIYPGGAATHITVLAGPQNFQIKKVGIPTTLLTTPLTTTTQTYNSVYVAGETPDKVFHIVDTLVTDTLPFFGTVRFVNAAPDAGNLKVTIGDTTYVKSSPFKSSSAFFLTGSGQKTIKVYQVGVMTPQIDTILTIQPGNAYTIFSRGLLNGKGNSALKVGLILNL